MSIRFVLSPSLGDGLHPSVYESKERVLEAVRAWLDESEGSDKQQCSIQTIDILPEVLAGLPEM